MSETYNVSASSEADEPEELASTEPFLNIQTSASINLKPYNFLELKPDFIPVKSCFLKVLKFSSEWAFRDAVETIHTLHPADYPNLFVFVIQQITNDEPHSTQNEILNVSEILEAKLIEFLKTSQIVIHLILGNESKFFYNKASAVLEEMEKLHEIELEGDEGGLNDQFPAFLRGFIRIQRQPNLPSHEFENAIFDLLKNPDELSLRFLTIFNVSFHFSFRVVSVCAAKFSKNHFFAAMDIWNDAQSFTQYQENLISLVFKNSEYKSILAAAVTGENIEIIQYLIDYCAYLVGRLPRKHQTEIANQLVIKNKIDILCKLLKSCDFAFPTETNISHQDFQEIMNEREELHEAIRSENYIKIDEFKEKYKNLDIAYNIKNESALYTAEKVKKGELFLHLIEKGFKDMEANIDYYKYMLLNIEVNSSNPEQAVDSLTSRSRIYGKDADYHAQIKKVRDWLAAINKTEFGGVLLSAAAQCRDLRIVFDFNKTNVEGVDLVSRTSDGIFYWDGNIIIVAAQHSSDDEMQRVKGVLAHELTHFVMMKLFQNRCNPYYSESDPRYQKYKPIVDKYKYLKTEGTEDDCEGIMWRVYRCYQEHKYPAELIVRVFEIQARYDKNPAKVSELEIIYKDLFGYAKDELIVLMCSLNMKEMEIVETFNNFVGVMSTIQKLNIHFPAPDIAKILISRIDNNPVIVTTNVPKLFLAQIYSDLSRMHGNLVNSKNIFVTQNELARKNFLNEFKLIVEKVEELSCFLDFSDESFEISNGMEIPIGRNFIFIVSNENHSNHLSRFLQGQRLSPYQATINYEWNSLPSDVKNYFLNYKVNFQKHSKLSLSKLFQNSCDITRVIDADLMNKMLNNEEISVNENLSIAKYEHFNDLNIKRKFMKIDKETKNQEISKKDKERIKQKELIKENRNQKFVLITDVAGNGKSWAMRSLALEISCVKKTSWVTFVDLKFHFKFFKNWKKEPNMYDFMLEEVLKDFTNIEKEIFKQKYQNGQVVIFLDGFDEIAPDCAKFVTNLMKSLKDIKGIQVFVSTRDYFEKNLKEELNVECTYKLAVFRNYDGIDLICRIWALHDGTNLDTCDMHEKYFELAIGLILKVAKRFEFGTPQIFSMIGKITKKTKKLDESLNIFQLYDEMWRQVRKEWESGSKGEIRRIEGEESQDRKLKFNELHELIAMKRFSPGRSSYCDLDTDNIELEWSEDNSIDGCGLLTKNDQEYFFVHETFYEFFVAKFILRNLRYLESAAEAFNFMQASMLNDKNKVIRKFLDLGLYAENMKTKNSKTLNVYDKNYGKRLQILSKSINHDTEQNVIELLLQNLLYHDTFSDFLIEIFKKRGSESFEENIRKKIIKLIKMDDSSINSQELFIDLILSRIDIQIIFDVAGELNKNKGPSFMKELIQLNDDKGNNIFYKLLCSDISNSEQFEKFIEFLKKFLSPSEIEKKMKEFNRFGDSVLHYGSSFDQNKFFIYLEGYKKFFETELTLADFRNFLKSLKIFEILHEAEYFDTSDNFQGRFWTFLLEACESDRNLLMELLLEQDSGSTNISCLNCYTSSDKPLGLTFLEYFVETNERIGKLFKNADIYGNNYFHYISSFMSCSHGRSINYTKVQEIIELMLSSKDHVEEWKKFNFNKFGHNFLQFKILFINRLYECDTSWTTLQKFFNPTKIIDLVKHRDIFGYNFLHLCLFNSNYEVQVIAKEFIDVIRASGLGDEGSIKKLEILITKRLNRENIIDEEMEILSLNWIDTGNPPFEPPEITFGKFKELLLHKNYRGDNFINRFVENGNFDYAVSILKKYEADLDEETLDDILTSKSDCSESLLHTFAQNKETHYKLLWRLMRDKLSTKRILEIIKHKNKRGSNLLFDVVQYGAEESAKFTWQQIEEMFQNDVIQIIQERNDDNQNILQLAAHGINCSFRFFLSEFEKYVKSPVITKNYIIQINTHYHEPTILFNHQFCADKKCHEVLWNILLNNPDRDELRAFMMYQNTSKKNFLNSSSFKNLSAEVKEFILKKLKEVFFEADAFNLFMKG